MNILNQYKKLYIIAEIGVNHNGNLQTAYKLIDFAVKAGADCVKFQAFSANELSIKKFPKFEYQKNNINENQHDMLLRYELTENDFKKIKCYCDNRKIHFLATPFSEKWVNILYDLGVDLFKISSGSLNSKLLLSVIGSKKLPVILSTGMSNTKEIDEAIKILKQNGCLDISLLHCVSLYPTTKDQVNLFSISYLKEKYKLRVGFSDHTREVDIGGLSVAAGATIIEKHFTLNKKMKGPDHSMSLSPYQLKKYIEYAREVAVICGSKTKPILQEELIMKRNAQTSLVTKKKIKKGEIIVRENLIEKRPSLGISVDKINDIIGKCVNKDIEKDSYFRLEDIEF